MSTIDVSFDEGLIQVQLNRPDRLNAISPDLAEELVERVVPLGEHPDARVLVVSGAGRAFCAGADVAAATGNGDLSVADSIAAHARMQQALDSFAAMPVVKIAQVHGHCVGAGLVLASMCELRIAAADAKFSIPELAFGIPFSMGGLPRIVRLIGLTKTADLVLTGRRMEAQEGLQAGLVTEVVGDLGDLSDVVSRQAKMIARHPRFLIRETVARLAEAGRDLLDGSRSDLSSLVLATLDSESRAVMDGYADKVLKRSMT